MANEFQEEEVGTEEVEVEFETEAVLDFVEDDDDIEEEETQEDRDTELEQLRKENKTLKIQKAKKAQKVEQSNQAAPNTSNGDLSTQDLYTLMDAKVSAEDISDVTDWATHKKISISEALKSSVVKAILEEKQNSRKVASATNTGSARRGISEVSGEDLLANARNNKMPDIKDIDKLVAARMENRKR